MSDNTSTHPYRKKKLFAVLFQILEINLLFESATCVGSLFVATPEDTFLHFPLEASGEEEQKEEEKSWYNPWDLL